MPSQDCHLFDFIQLYQVHLYLVIDKSCRDDDASFFMFFFHLVFLALNVLIGVSLLHVFVYVYVCL